MPGFPVFGTGQPTLGGFDKVLEPILKKYGDEKIIYWANLRQEPVVYVNGKPYTARDPEKYAFFLLDHNQSSFQIQSKYKSFRRLHISILLLLNSDLSFYSRLNYHIEVANAADVSKMEDDFAEEIKKRGDDFKFFQDQYGEHPDDRVVNNDEVTEKLAEVQTLTQIFGGLKEKVCKLKLIMIQIT